MHIPLKAVGDKLILNHYLSARYLNKKSHMISRNLTSKSELAFLALSPRLSNPSQIMKFTCRNFTFNVKITC